MKTFTAFFCALFVAGTAFADPYAIAKQQAKNAVASENRNQQAIAAAGSAAPAPASPSQNNPAAAAPANPALQATLQNIASLRDDFETLVSGPTNAASAQLINDLTAAAQSKKPSSAAISKLAGDLTVLLAGNDKLRTQPPKLAQWVHAVFNSSHLSPAQSQMIHDGVQKIFADAGASIPDAANVINDLQTIAMQTQ